MLHSIGKRQDSGGEAQLEDSKDPMMLLVNGGIEVLLNKRHLG